MPYNKNTNWSNEEEYLNNLIKTGNAGEKAWAQNQLGALSQAKSQYGNPVTPTAPAATTNPYNESTNFANESAYLTDLSKNGSAGEQAWANNQMDVLNDAMAQYGVVTNSPTMLKSSYAPTGTYNDADLPTEAKAQIEAFKQAYDEAIAKGDTAAAEKAHAGAEAVRAQYGYSGGTDGSDKIALANIGLASNDILSWNDIYDAANPKPTYEEPTVNGNKYSEETERLLSEILSREDFSYNVETDPLYAQFKTMYNREGDRAMRDTLAEAASSAGGMNSYAITAAQQANNYYASQLNDKIPELHQLAYEMYLQDKESKVENLGLLSQLDDKQYNRYRDTMSDYWNDKSFAYGTYTDAITQGNWEKTFDYNQSVNDRDYQTNQQAAARDEVWKLISIGVTPSADLVAKAGMNQTDIDLAVAAVKGSYTSDNGNTSNNNGYTGNKGNSGNSGNTSNNSDYTGTPTATTGVTDELRKKAASFTSNNALANWAYGLSDSGVIEEEDADKLIAEFMDHDEKFKFDENNEPTKEYSYSDMVKSTNGWEVLDDGGFNWFWGVDNNAIVKAPNGERVRLDNLVDKLVSEGMTKDDAKAAVKALQGNLKM